MLKSKLIAHSALSILACILYCCFIGDSRLFDWDEINFAEIAREMVVTGQYLQVQIDFKMFWEKPPLFFWMQALSMKFFGIGEFASRFPNALLGILTANILLHIGTQIKNLSFGLLWAGLYGLSLLPFIYFKSGIIDPWLNTFIFLSLFTTHQYIEKRNVYNLIASGILLGLGILCKGPVAIIIWGLTGITYYFLNKKNIRFPLAPLSLVVCISLSIPGIWFFIDYINNGSDFIIDFITYQIELFKNPGAGHQQPFFYHPVIILLGCFPMSAFLLPAIKFKRLHQLENGKFLQICWISFLTVLILFSIVETKIIHYSSFCYLPLSFICAHYLHNNNLSKKNMRIFLIIGILLSLSLILVVWFMASPDYWNSWITDDWNRLKMEANAKWYHWEIIYGLILLSSIIICYLKIDKWQIKSIYISLFFMGSVTFCIYGVFTPRIEQLSQSTYIKLMQEYSKENQYFALLGFSSYAHYFYTKITPSKDPIDLLKRPEKRYHLLAKDIDKDAYFLCPSKKSKKFMAKWKLKEIKTINAWTILIRKATN